MAILQSTEVYFQKLTSSVAIQNSQSNVIFNYEFDADNRFNSFSFDSQLVFNGTLPLVAVKPGFVCTITVYVQASPLRTYPLAEVRHTELADISPTQPFDYYKSFRFGGTLKKSEMSLVQGERVQVLVTFQSYMLAVSFVRGSILPITSWLEVRKEELAR